MTTHKINKLLVWNIKNLVQEPANDVTHSLAWWWYYAHKDVRNMPKNTSMYTPVMQGVTVLSKGPNVRNSKHYFTLDCRQQLQKSLSYLIQFRHPVQIYLDDISFPHIWICHKSHTIHIAICLLCHQSLLLSEHGTVFSALMSRVVIHKAQFHLKFCLGESWMRWNIFLKIPT